MALFSRKNPLDAEETVRLSSADHTWWAGEPVADLDAPADGFATEGDDDPSSRIAAALEEYGYGAAVEGLDLAGLTGVPTGHGGTDPDGTAGAAGAGVDESALFTHDGLPAEDRLAQLLGTLGLEANADWVDIARAHRRMVAAAGGSAGVQDEQRRRAANEAYACLRLFHH